MAGDTWGEGHNHLALHEWVPTAVPQAHTNLR